MSISGIFMDVYRPLLLTFINNISYRFLIFRIHKSIFWFIRIMVMDNEFYSLACLQINNYNGLFTRKTLQIICKTYKIMCSPDAQYGALYSNI